MSCTCFSVRLLTGLAALVISTSASQATGVKTRPASWVRWGYAGRALAAKSTCPESAWSMPSMVLNGCTSRWPWPVSAKASATAVTSPSVLTWSPHTVSARLEALWWWCLTGAAVAATAKASETDAVRRPNERTNMNEIPKVAGTGAQRLWRKPTRLQHAGSATASGFCSAVHASGECCLLYGAAVAEIRPWSMTRSCAAAEHHAGAAVMDDASHPNLHQLSFTQHRQPQFAGMQGKYVAQRGEVRRRNVVHPDHEVARFESAPRRAAAPRDFGDGDAGDTVFIAAGGLVGKRGPGKPRIQRCAVGFAADRGQLRVELELMAVAIDAEHHRAADGGKTLGVAEVLGIAHRVAVDTRDEITRLQTGRRGWRTGEHVGDQRAVRGLDAERARDPRRQVLRIDAEAPSLDLAVRDELLHHLGGEIGRDRESQPRARARGRIDHRVDADELPREVHQRAARVARIDRGVGLDVVLDAALPQVLALQPGNDARGRGLAEAERVADRHHEIADAQFRGIGQRQRDEIGRVDLDHRKVGLRVGADHFRLVRLAVGERHLDVVGALDHVVVGEDVAFGRVDDHARAERLLDQFPRRWNPRQAEELAHEEIG